MSLLLDRLPGGGALGKSLNLLKLVSQLQISTTKVRIEEYNAGEKVGIAPGT